MSLKAWSITARLRLCLCGFVVMLSLINPVSAFGTEDLENYTYNPGPAWNYSNVDLSQNVTTVYSIDPYTEPKIFLLAIIACCQVFNLVLKIWGWFTDGGID